MIKAFEKRSDGRSSPNNSSSDANANNADEDIDEDEDGNTSFRSGTNRNTNSFKHRDFSSSMHKNRDSTPKNNQRVRDLGRENRTKRGTPKYTNNGVNSNA